MKLLFKQRIFSWFDSYDIYDEAGNTIFTVEGQFDWGHRLHVLDARGSHVGTLKQRMLTFMPQFEIYVGETCLGCIRKEFSFLKPRFSLECLGWQVQGELFEWDYEICDSSGSLVATVTKELLNWSDTYTIDVADPAHALYALMVVLAIDAEKCSRN